MTTTPLEAALAIIDATPAANESQMLVKSKIRGLLRGYDAVHGVPDFEVVDCEVTVSADLYNPETQARSRTFRIGGKLDMTVIRNGQRVLFDHKTSSEDIKDPASPYWRQLIVEMQPSHYALLEWLNGRKVNEITWDVIKKPEIRPKQISKQDRMFTASSGVYFGSPVSKACMEEMRHTEKESLAMYEARLAHDCSVLRPDHYFQRRTVPRLDSDILEHAEELWQNAHNILQMRAQLRKGKLPPRHSGSCMTYGRPCNYLGICSGFSDPEDGKWQKKAQVHSELVLEGDGRDLLTNSSVRCFQTCPRKFYYSYHLGIEKVEEDEVEALWFGSLLHQGLEAYFLKWKEIQQGESNGNTTATVPAIETGSGGNERDQRGEYF